MNVSVSIVYNLIHLVFNSFLINLVLFFLFFIFIKTNIGNLTLLKNRKKKNFFFFIFLYYF